MARIFKQSSFKLRVGKFRDIVSSFAYLTCKENNSNICKRKSNVSHGYLAKCGYAPLFLCKQLMVTKHLLPGGKMSDHGTNI